MVEAIKTEKYDYSENADQREQIITELYELPTEQLFKVRSFARKLKEEKHRMKQLSCREHFRLTVLPLLKSFVESQGAELEITEEPDDVITATIAEVNSLNLGLISLCFSLLIGGWTPLRTGFVCISHTA